MPESLSIGRPSGRFGIMLLPQESPRRRRSPRVPPEPRKSRVGSEEGCENLDLMDLQEPHLTYNYSVCWTRAETFRCTRRHTVDLTFLRGYMPWAISRVCLQANKPPRRDTRDFFIRSRVPVQRGLLSSLAAQQTPQRLGAGRCGREQRWSRSDGINSIP